MANLAQAITIPVWNTDRVHEFSDTSRLQEWATNESAIWADTPKPSIAELAVHWSRQINSFEALRNAAQSLDSALNKDDLSQSQIDTAYESFRNDIGAAIAHISDGRIITSDNTHFSDIIALSVIDPDSAGMLLAASTSRGRQHIQTLFANNHFPYDKFIIGSLGSSKRSYDFERSHDQRRKQVETLGNDLEKRVNAAQVLLDKWGELFTESLKSDQESLDERVEGWAAQMQMVREQWDSALRAYDEKMALAAPTTYWRKRATVSMISAICYGALFSVLITVSLYLFSLHAIPYLASVSVPNVPILSAVLPVIIPAFAGVWILRIVGRLLGENLQLMQDAKERETMVMTFLALMNDDVRGKSLVTDNDRLLILHSLFRPSSVSAIDDSPPVHWFDILSRKFGTPGK